MESGKNNKELPRLSKKELIILELLVNTGEMYGLEMVKESQGNLKRGSIYVLLSRMAEKGYVESREEPREFPEIGIPRRKFWATGIGES
ncbi:MAG: helix-turn-helix transcriptional regulator, partial [Acidobacteria bacterium]|nr:helix-turn-helix transcriptional regulator [Acidobacteriota bacterium]